VVDLAKAFGESWTKKSLVSQLVQMGKEKVYLSRLTAVIALGVRP
jgi:hypothetical protein